MTTPTRTLPNAGRCVFTGRPLHDIQEWDVAQEWGSPRPDGVPSDAKPHRGFLDAGGSQIVVWLRTTPPTGDDNPNGFGVGGQTGRDR